MRVIRGADVYWALYKDGAARIPQAMVTDEDAVAPLVRAAMSQTDPGPSDADRPYHLTVYTTTACNLACAYCFQNVSVTSGQNPTRIPARGLSDAAIEGILIFARRRLAATGRDGLELMLFGGEPLLRPHACLTLLRGSQEIGLRGASMVTNAVPLTAALARKLASAGLRDVQVTLDGDRADHDRSRVTLGGRGTFDQIVRNLAAASAVPQLRLQLRVNLTAANLDSASALIDRLAAVLEPARFSLYFALVHDAGIFDGVTLPAAELGHRVAALYMAAIDAGFEVAVPRASTDCADCGTLAGRTGAVVNADGTLYSCWESVGRPGYEVGHIDTGYLPEEALAPRWVACGYADGRRPEPADLRHFRDIVDLAILNRMYADGRLDTRTVR